MEESLSHLGFIFMILRVRHQSLIILLINSQGQKPKDQKAKHGGIIEFDEDRKGIKYKIRISEHVKNIIRNDSLSKKLGLVVSSDIENSINTDLKNNNELEYIPISSVVNPLGTVLYGPNPEPLK